MVHHVVLVVFLTSTGTIPRMKANISVISDVVAGDMVYYPTALAAVEYHDEDEDLTERAAL